MHRTPVKSSQITSVGYDAASETLEIEFPTRKEARHGGEAGVGSVYQYAKVPPTTYEALMSAQSVGQYFGANIRGRFEYSRMAPEKDAISQHSEGGGA